MINNYINIMTIGCTLAHNGGMKFLQESTFFCG